jgi:hypothetical protein
MTKEVKKNNHSILKFIILSIMVSAIILSILFAYNGEILKSFDWNTLSPARLFEEISSNRSAEKDISIKLGELNIKASAMYMGNLLILSDNDIRLLNAKGEEIWYITHDIRQPVLQTEGQWILVYDHTGKSYMVINKGKLLIDDTLEENISFGDISENYILFISWSNTGYKRTVHLVSPENGSKFGVLYIDDYYPYYSVISDNKDEGYFILNGLSMNSSKITTIFRKYSSNLNSGLIADVQLDGLFSVMLDTQSKSLFIGENNAYCYNNDLEYLWSLEFDQNINAAGIFDDGSSVLALHGQENVLCFYDSLGKEVNRVTVGEKINSIVTIKNTAAVLCGPEASFYNASGKFIDKVSISGLNIKLHFADEKKVYLLSEHEVIVHNLK